MNKLTQKYTVPERKLSRGEIIEGKNKKMASVQAMINSSRAPKEGKWRLFNKFLAK